MSGPDPNIGSLIMGLRYEQAMWPAPKLTKSSIEITRLVCENEHLTDRRIAEIGWNGLKTSKGGVLQFWPHSGVPLLKNLCYSSCHSFFEQNKVQLAVNLQLIWHVWARCMHTGMDGIVWSGSWKTYVRSRVPRFLTRAKRAKRKFVK